MARPATSTLRAAVIGTGAISTEHLAFIAGSPIAVLDSVCDLSAASARFAAERFGAAHTTTDVEEALARQPQVVHVLTPPGSHGPLIRRALECGADVICEKPMATTAAECEDLLQLAEQLGRSIVESHNYLFNRPILAIDELVLEGRLGAVRDVDIRLCGHVLEPGSRFVDPNLPHPVHALPGGLIHDFVTHLVSMLLHFAPGPYERIAAAWSDHGHREGIPIDDLDALCISDGPDGPVHARLRFDALSSPEGFTVNVRGSAGSVTTDLYNPSLQPRLERSVKQLSPIVNDLANGSALLRASVKNLGGKFLQRGVYEGLHTMLDRTYSAWLSGDPAPVTHDSIRRVATMVDSLLAPANRL